MASAQRKLTTANGELLKVQLRQEGLLGAMKMLGLLSIFIHERHINLLGRYAFAVSEALIRGELRPLQNPTDLDA